MRFIKKWKKKPEENGKYIQQSCRLKLKEFIFYFGLKRMYFFCYLIDTKNISSDEIVFCLYKQNTVNICAFAIQIWFSFQYKLAV